MQIIRGIGKIRRFHNAVVALGVFDGVHRGHISILRKAASFARRIGGRSEVLTFWPHPQREKSLYSLKHRLKLIAEEGIDVCIVINFNRSFSGITARSFVKDILVKKLNARYVYVGKNFRFGRHAEGDIKTLFELSDEYDFRLKVFNVVTLKGRPVSSTYIRGLIAKGRLRRAGEFLGRPVDILGTVIKGKSIARKLGFPTANINPHHEVIPPSGIYAVNLILGKRKLKGACYIGRKPTFNRKADKHIEAHIFNFNKNIYGKDVRVEFLEKIRDDKKFNSSQDLANQIKKDINKVKTLLLRHK